MRRVLLLASALAFVPAAAGVRAQQTVPTEAPLTLDRLEQMALEHNPTVRQALAAVEAARGRASQAGALPNPIVGYSGEELSSGSTEPRGEHGFFVEQSIPLGGKLARGRTVFEREAAAAEASLELQRQRIRNDVRALYYEVLTAERRVEVAEQLARLVAEAVQITRQLYNVGAADRPDVLESEVESRRMQLRLDGAKNRQFGTWRRLSAVVGVDLQPAPLGQTIDEAIPEMDRGTAARTLRERSPELQVARLNLERTRAEVDRASRETYPDLFVRGGAAWNREVDEHRFPLQATGWQASVEVGMSIPLFDRNAGGVAAARAGQTRADAEVRRLELALEARLGEVFEQYLTALRATEMYRAEILPRAREAYRLYLSRYREMAAAYPQVLIAQRTLLEMNDEYLAAVEQGWRAALQIQGYLVSDSLGSGVGAGEARAPGGTRQGGH